MDLRIENVYIICGDLVGLYIGYSKTSYNLDVIGGLVYIVAYSF